MSHNISSSPPFQVFRFFDEDDDGSITGEEVKRVMAKLGENLSEEEINEMVKEADLDGNGRIEYAGEFFVNLYRSNIIIIIIHIMRDQLFHILP